jgi:hypothetical protein
MLMSLAALALLADPTGVAHLKITVVRLTTSEQKTAIAKVVNREIHPLKGCYDLALKDSPHLKGEIELHFRLEGGVPGEMRVADSSTVKDDTVAQCMMARLGSAAWPKTKAGAAVTLRLKLAR